MSEEDKKVDYLEVDEAIPGQNYVCLSFLSPESLMKNKEGFKVVKFLQSYCKEQKLKYDDVYSQYHDFIYKYYYIPLKFSLSIFEITRDKKPFISTTPLPNNFPFLFISLKGLADHFCPSTDTVSI